jgi:predicted N-acyltransferase
MFLHPLAAMMDILYYPKLQGCVPFSPVPGPRLLTIKHEEGQKHDLQAIQRGLAAALIQLMGA